MTKTFIATAALLQLKSFDCELFIDALGSIDPGVDSRVTTIDVPQSIYDRLFKNNLLEFTNRGAEFLGRLVLNRPNDAELNLPNMANGFSVTYLLDARGNVLGQLVTA